MEDIIISKLTESIETKQKVLELLIPNIKKLTEMVLNAYKNSGRLIIFGNGGSAADAQHIVAELVNKVKIDRPMLDALSLTVNTSILTAIGNDWNYNDVFTRQVESLVKKEDVVVGLSTSGNSVNVINGLIKAKERGATVIGLTGEDGGRMKHLGLDLLIKIPSRDVARIQESHITIGHIMCEIIEEELFGNNKNK